MRLYLVQHGKSLPKDQDPEQGISPEGMEETRRIAGVAQGYGVKVARIFHSGKKRALQTAEIFQEILSPPAPLEQRSGLKPMDDVTAIAADLSGLADGMLVGHLPFMARLTSYLITERVDTPVFTFQNSGIVCLEKEPETGWTIKWTLMPNIS